MRLARRPLPARRVYMLFRAVQQFLFEMMFTVLPIYFVATVGMNPLQLVLVGTALEGTVLLLEVPTSVVADTFSHRLSVIIGAAVLGAGFVLTGLAPVFAWVIAIAMMLGGVLAIVKLPVSQYPPIAPPSITIRAQYTGASAKTVEDSVIQIIESKMTGLDSMLYISSVADSSGNAEVTLTFTPETDPDLAWSKVQNKLQLALPALPDSVQKQGVTVSKSTRNFLLIVGLLSEDGSLTRADLADYVTSQIESPLARVPGVGEVQVFGTGYSMRLWIDPDKLTKYGMTIDDVVAAVRAYNVEVSAGQFGGAPSAIEAVACAQPMSGERCSTFRMHRNLSSKSTHPEIVFKNLSKIDTSSERVDHVDVFRAQLASSLNKASLM